MSDPLLPYLAETDAGTRLQKYRPTRAKRIAAGGAIALGALMLLPLIDAPTPTNTATALAYFVAFALPGAYWHLRNRADTRTVRAWAQAREEYSTNWELLAISERRVFARLDDELPLLPKRHWWAVAAVCFLALVVGGVTATTL